MADITKTVEFIFGGKNEVTAVVNDIAKDFGKFDQIVTSVTDPLAKVGESILKVDAALAALAIGGMAAALKVSADFNQGFALISTSVSATGEALAKYKEDILVYSTTSTKSISDINAAIYTAVQAGVDYEQSLEFISKAEQLAVANKANLNTTVDLLTGTMNAYGLSVGDVGRLNDVFFTSTLIGKQTIDELGQSMGSVVNIAATAGVSFEELSAAIATLTKKGMVTAEAITAVKGVITTFINPSKEASEAAQKLGVDLSYAGLNSKGLSAALQDIVLKTGGSKEKMIEMFTEMRAMAGITGLASDKLKVFAWALEETKNSLGNAEEAAVRMAISFKNQMQIIENSILVTLIKIGTRLEPLTAGIAKGVSDIFVGVKVAFDDGAFDPLFDFLREISESLSSWLGDVGKAVPGALAEVDFQVLIDAFRNLGEAIASYFGDMDFTTIEDLGDAFQWLVDVMSGLINVTAGMVEGFKPFATQIFNFITSMSESGTETEKTIGKVLAFSMAIQELGLLVVAAIMFINEYRLSMMGLFNVLAGGVQVLWNGFEILLTGLKGAVILIAGLFVELIDHLTFGLMPGLDEAKEKLTEWGSSIGPAFEKNGAEAAAGLSRLTTGLGQLINTSGDAKKSADTLSTSLKDVPPKTEPEIILHHEEATKGIAGITTGLAEIPAEKDVKVQVQADGSTIEKAYGMIKQTFPDGHVVWTNAEVKTDPNNLTSTKSKIKEAAPDKKEVDVEVKLRTEQIKAQADIIQKSIEWKAKIDIADIESNFKVIEKLVDNIGIAIESTGDTLVGLADAVIKDKGWNSEILDEFEKEASRREEAFDMQRKMTDTQVEYMKKRIEQMNRGEAMIQIDGAGLQPHLEAFMFEILAAIQIRASAEGAQFLTGL